MTSTSNTPIDPIVVRTAEYLETLRHDNSVNKQLAETWELFHECIAPLIDQLVSGRGLSRDVADDVRQEVWMQIVRSLPNLNNKNMPSFMAWLSTVIDHKVAQHFRGNQRKTIILDAPLEVPAPHDGDNDCQSELLELALKRLKQTTSPLNYGILLMRLVDGHSVQEVAAEFRLSADRVRYRTHRARLKLRAILEQLIDDE